MLSALSGPEMRERAPASERSYSASSSQLAHAIEREARRQADLGVRRVEASTRGMPAHGQATMRHQATGRAVPVVESATVALLEVVQHGAGRSSS